MEELTFFFLLLHPPFMCLPWQNISLDSFQSDQREEGVGQDPGEEQSVGIQAECALHRGPPARGINLQHLHH